MLYTSPHLETIQSHPSIQTLIALRCYIHLRWHFSGRRPPSLDLIRARCALGKTHLKATNFLVLYKLQATVIKGDIKGESPNLCWRKSLLPAAVIDSTGFRLVAFNLRLYLLNCTPACSKLISEKVFRKYLPSYSKSKFNNNHACVDVSNFISIGNTNSTKIWNSPTVQCTRFVMLSGWKVQRSQNSRSVE